MYFLISISQLPSPPQNFYTGINSVEKVPEKPIKITSTMETQTSESLIGQQIYVKPKKLKADCEVCQEEKNRTHVKTTVKTFETQTVPITVESAKPVVVTPNYISSKTLYTNRSLTNIPENPRNTKEVKDVGKISRPPQVHKNVNLNKKHKRKTTSITELLMRIPAISHLPEYKFKELGRHYTEKVSYKKGQTIYSIEHKARDLYFIKSGQVSLSNRQGNTLGVRSKGEFFGQEALTGPNNQRFDTVTVLTDEVVLYKVNNSGLFDDDTFVMSHIGTVISSTASNSLVNNTIHNRNLVNYGSQNEEFSSRGKIFDENQELRKIASKYDRFNSRQDYNSGNSHLSSSQSYELWVVNYDRYDPYLEKFLV